MTYIPVRKNQPPSNPYLDAMLATQRRERRVAIVNALIVLAMLVGAFVLGAWIF